MSTEPTPAMVEAGARRLELSWHDGPTAGLMELIIRDIWQAMAGTTPLPTPIDGES